MEPPPHDPRPRSCFATCSLSSWSRPLPEKLQAIRDAGFEAIEMAFPDLCEYGKLIGRVQKDDDYGAIAEVAKQVRQLTDKLGLKIAMLQPFSRFEGWTKDRHGQQRQEAFARAREWIKIMDALGTDMLQVGSSDAPDVSPSFHDMASDLADLADLMAPRGYRIAYENWCWATYASSWKAAWEVVSAANRHNLGLCLDTFQSAGGEFGDPTTESGRVESMSEKDLETSWRRRLDELAGTVPADRIFILQISDAYKMSPPLKQEEESLDGEKPRAIWSRNYRPLPFEGGYLPVTDFFGSVMSTGFDGWLSIEVFDSKKGATVGMEEYAKSSMDAIRKLQAGRSG